jgi:hypothetical protein
MVEYGSGVTSIRMVLAFPELSLTSLEHDSSFALETETLKRRFAPERRLRILHAPLQYQRIGSRVFRTYRDPRLEGPVSAVLIDGPPLSTSLNGREACLHQIYGALQVGGIVILDDYHRRNEQRVVRNWMRTYPGGFELDVLERAHHLAVLRKVRSVLPRWSAWRAELAGNVTADLLTRAEGAREALPRAARILSPLVRPFRDRFAK